MVTFMSRDRFLPCLLFHANCEQFCFWLNEGKFLEIVEYLSKGSKTKTNFRKRTMKS